MPAEDFIHPIIQAFVAGRQHALDRARLLQEGTQFNEKQKQEHDQFEEQRQQGKDLADAARELEGKRLEFEQKRADVEHQLQGAPLLMQILQQGGKQVPYGTANAISIPGVGNVQLGSPQDRFNLMRQEAAAKSGGDEEGRNPFQLQRITAEGDQARQTSQQQQQFTTGENAKNRQAEEDRLHEELSNQMKIANLSRGSQERIEGARLGMEQNKINAEYGTPDTNRGLIYDFASGGAKPSSNNPRHMNAVTQMQSNGLQPVDPKTVESLKTLQGLSPQLDRMAEFTNQLPSENSEGSLKAKFKAMGQKYLANSPWPSDLKNEFGDVLGQMTNVGKGLEGLSGGRILSKQFETEMNSLAAPGQTKEQAQNHVNTLRQIAQDAQKLTVGGLEPAQIDIINKRNGLAVPKYDDIKVNPKTGHKIGIRNGKTYDFDTDQQISAPPVQPQPQPTVPAGVQ